MTHLLVLLLALLIGVVAGLRADPVHRNPLGGELKFVAGGASVRYEAKPQDHVLSREYAHKGDSSEMIRINAGSGRRGGCTAGARQPERARRDRIWTRTRISSHLARNEAQLDSLPAALIKLGGQRKQQSRLTGWRCNPEEVVLAFAGNASSIDRAC